MKVLSLKEPWASLIAAGVKSIETRSWQTSYRGELAIHASLAKINPDAAKVLFEKNERDAATKRAFYARKAESNWKPGV